MSTAFVPLTVSRGAHPTASGFHPLSAPVPAVAAHPQDAGHAPTPPKVTLRREGDRVTHIRIECGCGEVVELACAY